MEMKINTRKGGKSMKFSSDIEYEELGAGGGCWTVGVPVAGCFTLGKPDTPPPAI